MTFTCVVVKQEKKNWDPVADHHFSCSCQSRGQKRKTGASTLRQSTEHLSEACVCAQKQVSPSLQSLHSPNTHKSQTQVVLTTVVENTGSIKAMLITSTSCGNTKVVIF